MGQGCLRTFALYLILLLAVRLMGKRQVGQLEPSEFVVTMVVADLACGPMEDPQLSLLAPVAPIATVLLAELLLSALSLRSLRFRSLLCGKPVILIENGRILRGNLRRNRVTLDELLGQLRQKEILDPSAVQYAILETNGTLSVFPYPWERPAAAREAGIPVDKQYLPVTVVSDGRLLRENLAFMGKNEAWLQDFLRGKGTTLADTCLLTVDRGGRVRWYPRED